MGRLGSILRLIHFAVLVAGFVLLAGLTAEAQAPAPSSQPSKAQQPKRAKKVWTEEDLVALRTDSDLYQREKDRKADADAKAAKEKAEKGEKAERTEEGPKAEGEESEAEAQKPEGEGGTPEEAGPPEETQAAQTREPSIPPRAKRDMPTNPTAIRQRIAELDQEIDDLQSQLNGAEMDAARLTEEKQVEANERAAILKKHIEEARAERAELQGRLGSSSPGR